MTDENATPAPAETPASVASAAAQSLPVAPVAGPRGGRLAGDVAGLLASIGAGLLVVAFFLPWWSADAEFEGKPEKALKVAGNALEDNPELALDIADAVVGNIDWYLENLTVQMIVEPAYDEMREYLQAGLAYKKRRNKVWRRVQELERELDEGSGGRIDWEERYKRETELRGKVEEELGTLEEPELRELNFAVRLFGWKTGVGTAALALAVVTLLIVLSARHFKVLQRQRWIADLLLLCAAVILAIYIAVFFIATPGENVEIPNAIEFSQGVSVGVFVAIVGVGWLIAGLARSGLAGVRRLQEALEAKGPATSQRPEEPASV